MYEGETQLIFTPDNEPYLGGQLLFQFDNLICSCLEQTGKVAPKTHDLCESDLQQAACQLIPQNHQHRTVNSRIDTTRVSLRCLGPRPAARCTGRDSPLPKQESERSGKVELGVAHDEAPSLAKMFRVVSDNLTAHEGLERASANGAVQQYSSWQTRFCHREYDDS